MSLANHFNVYGNVLLRICTGKAETKEKRKDFSDFAYQIIFFYCPDRVSRITTLWITTLEGTIREGLVSQQHPRNCKGCPRRAASQTLEPQHALPQWFSGGTDTQTLYRLSDPTSFYFRFP